MAYSLVGVLILFLSPGFSHASEVMFEGYYRMTIEGKSVGYTIQRYTFDKKKSVFEFTSFTRAKFGEEVRQESIKAKSDDAFRPISYQYTGMAGTNLKTIDASFKGQVMTLKITEGKETKSQTYKIPEKTILSSFLTYMLIQNPRQVGKPYRYSAVAEEEGNSYWGRVQIDSSEKKDNHVVLTVRNSFRGDEFVARLAAFPDGKEEGRYVRAEWLKVELPPKRIAIELMGSPNLATEGHELPSKTLISLFGVVPTGKVNMIATPFDPAEKEL